jgi:hypothetical protein
MHQRQAKYTSIATMVAIDVLLLLIMSMWYPGQWWSIGRVAFICLAIVINTVIWSIVILLLIKPSKVEWWMDITAIWIIHFLICSSLAYVMEKERPKYVLQFAGQMVELDEKEVGINSDFFSGPRFFTLKKSILFYAQDPVEFENEMKKTKHWEEKSEEDLLLRGKNVSGTDYAKTVVFSKKQKYIVWYNKKTRKIDNFAVYDK